MVKVKVNTTAYHPHMDGLTENFNCTLRSMLAKHRREFGTFAAAFVRVLNESP